MNTGRVINYLCFLELILIILFRDVDCTADDGFCEVTGDKVTCVSEEEVRLTRLKSDQIGEERTIDVDGGRHVQLKTVNTKPLVFEIEDFLTAEECEHFISVANEIGMVASHTEKHSQGGMSVMDLNSDKQLDFKEMKLTLENGFDVYLEDEDLVQMYTTLGIDSNNDNMLSREEMSVVQPKDLQSYINGLISDHPEKHSRFSSQAWLYPDQSTDQVFKTVQERVSTVVDLPMGLIRLSDFQVVSYGVDGHYNAHLDSSHIKPEVPCCDRGKQKRCRICRYMTILFYLNDVTEGGETAFPFANKDSINHTTAHLDRVHHLYKRCEDASLRISAKKGKAVIWYNHFIRDDDDWMGEVDEYTLHGGCPVKQGHKWIANFWIKTTNDKEKDLERMRKMY